MAVLVFSIDAYLICASVSFGKWRIESRKDLILFRWFIFDPMKTSNVTFAIFYI